MRHVSVFHRFSALPALFALALAGCSANMLGKKGASGSTASSGAAATSSAPSKPTGLALQTPATSPSTNQTPIIRVSGVANGYTVKLYSDSSCTVGNLLGTAAATGTTVDITSSSLAEGSYAFYAESTDAGALASGCSLVSVAYVVDLTAPVWANSVSHALIHATTSQTPSVTYTADATDALSGFQKYQYAIGTGTAGALLNDIVDWTDVAASPFQHSGIAPALSAGVVYYANMRALDNAGNARVRSSSGWTLPLSVVALYPVTPSTDPEWNYYVKKTGSTLYDADNTPCDPAVDTGYDGCIHAGELKKVVVTGVAACTGLTATDLRGAFDWTCDASSGTATFYSSGLKSTKGLKDLLNGATGTAFLTNSVTIAGITPNRQSSATTWWNNPVALLPDNNGGTARILDGVDDDGAGTQDQAYQPGQILTLIADRSTPGYNINADKYSVVTLNGAKLQWSGVATGNSNTTTAEYVSGGYRSLLSAGGQSFIWIEGNLDGSGATRAGMLTYFVGVKFSRLNQVIGDYNTAGSYAIYFFTNSHYNRVTGLTLTNTQYGLYCQSANASYVSGLSTNATSAYPFTLHACNNWVAQDLIASGATGSALYVRNASSGNRVSNLTMATGNYGIYMQDSSSNNVFRNLRISGTTNYGIIVTNGAYTYDANQFYDVRVSNSNGIIFWTSGGNRLIRASMTNIAGAGLQLISAPYTVASDLTVTSVGQSIGSSNPIVMNSSSYVTLTQSTVANANNWALTFGAPATYYVTHNFTSINAAGGIYNPATRSTFSQIAATHGGNPMYMVAASANNKVTGNFLIGNNSGSCFVDGAAVNPGLVNATCANQGTSDATLRTIVNTSTNFVGKVDPTQSIDANQLDTANTTDTNGTATWATGLDFLNFDNWYRGWGLDGGAFANSNHMRRCNGTDFGAGTCRIWDWRLTSAVTLLRDTTGTGNSANSSAFNAGNNCPNEAGGDQFLTTATFVYSATAGTTWAGDAIEETGVDGNEDGTCDAAETCFKRYLKNAVEITDPTNAGYSATGNHDGLCESNEACLYTPNFGSYQGHGTYGSCTFQPAGGSVTGVSMWGYATNGI